MKLSKMSKNNEILRLHKNEQKTMKFVNFIKISKNHEYLPIYENKQEP